MTVALETGQVQGNVLYAYGTRFPDARYVLLRVRPGRARDLAPLLDAWIRRVTFGRRSRGQPGHGRPHLNLAFTWNGLAALGVPAADLYLFPEDFRQGARRRSRLVGDRGESEGARWDASFGRAHVMLTVHARTGAEADGFVRELVGGQSGPDAPVQVLRVREAALLENRLPVSGREEGSCGTTFNREHFGFADGCSQPAIEGVHDDPEGGGLHARLPLRWLRVLRPIEVLTEDLGLRGVHRRWRAVRPGEFVLGYDNEDGRPPEGPGDPLGPNGTFMVYRELEQDVPAFEAHVAAQAEALDVDPVALRAKIVGRWPDGTPLSLSPDAPDPTVATNRHRANDFLFDDDRDGAKCPLGAHVRRTNPRDMLPGGAERTTRHRMIRRGMPYGPAFDPERPDDAERGLAFVCYGSSIRAGFEFVQSVWCGDGSAFGLGSEPDFLLQQRGEDGRMTGRMTIPGDQVRVLSPPPRPFVTVKGCTYLFLPSRRACAWLATLAGT